MHSSVSRILMAKGHTPISVFSEAFGQQIRALEENTATHRIPRLHGLYEADKGEFHYNPELHVQLYGKTVFSFPEECFELYPGEVCIIPKGMPHKETVWADGEPFENIVVSYYNEMIDIHLAREVSQGTPGAVEIKFFRTDFQGMMISYLESICEFHHYNPKVNAIAVKGLLLAEFSLLKTLVDQSDSHVGSNVDLVSLCKRLIHHNLQDESLSVVSLATELGCTPNHLSMSFHKKTGQRLTDWINRLRIQYAVDMLQTSQLSVKAIGIGCGYNSSNYFCRLFKEKTGRSPKQFREDSRRMQKAIER